MKSKLGIIFLISLSLQLNTQDYSIPFKSQKDLQYPYYNISLGKTENNFIVSLYYPYILFDRSQDEYEIPEQFKKTTKITPLLSSDSVNVTIITDSLKIKEGKTTKDLKEMDVLVVDSGVGKEKIAGYFGLAPTSSSSELEDVLTLNQLSKRGLVGDTVFSIGRIKKQTDGSYSGLLTLGKKHPDFQTNKGKSAVCTNKNKYFWGCGFKYLTLNSQSLEFKSDSKVILLNEEIVAYFDYDKYFEQFKKLFPNGSGCTAQDEETYSFYKCESWSVNEMQVKLRYNLDSKDHSLQLSVPDESDLYGLEKKHYEYTPSIHFVKGLKDVFIPMVWFKNYHVFFSKEKDGENTLIFHADDEKLIEISGENKEDTSSYIQISKTAFVFLCISVGIVLIFIVLFIGYVRMTSKKNVRGIQNKNGIKGTGASRIPTFDSSLLGTSMDSMPRRIRSSLN